jgi:hypothetical protein
MGGEKKRFLRDNKKDQKRRWQETAISMIYGFAEKTLVGGTTTHGLIKT